MIYQLPPTRKASDILTDAQYKELTERLARFTAWLGNRTADYLEDCPEDCRVSNAERGKLELYQFLSDPPIAYFCYIDEYTYKERQEGAADRATTWLGDTLSVWLRLGHEWRSNMGDKRQYVLFKAINGRFYSGIYYKSAGDYARVKAMTVAYGHRLNVF